MRSRYSAFTRGLWEYLGLTQTAPFDAPASVNTWVGLTVHDAKGDEVEFTARYIEGEREVSLRERSKFVQREGRWLYATGSPSVAVRKLGRNEPCPCGSGKKLKACHAS
jgi:SEC-C motif-containing protein